MDDRFVQMEARLQQLERKNRTLTLTLTTTLAILAVSMLVGWVQVQSQPSDQGIRTRSLIIEDAQGRPRIMFGSPIADRSERGNPRTGMVINDAAGVERFAVSLLNSDRVVMGFDAPVGKGDDRNRERITIVADEAGGGYIRFLDRKTRVPARLFLADDNRVWLEFLEFESNGIVRRRIGFSGDQTLKDPQ